MAARSALPQLGGSTFVTDGGMEVAVCGPMPGLNVVGGCCGTDERHIESICTAFAG
jgi:methionine synthase I (cobalamin-dependent)